MKWVKDGGRNATYASGGFGVRTTSSMVMMSSLRSAAASQNFKGDLPGTSSSSLAETLFSRKTLRAVALVERRAMTAAESLMVIDDSTDSRSVVMVFGAEVCYGDPETGWGRRM